MSEKEIMDLLSEIEKAGFEKVYTNTGFDEDGFIFFKNKETGEQMGYADWEMVKEYFYATDIDPLNEDFFHPNKTSVDTNYNKESGLMNMSTYTLTVEEMIEGSIDNMSQDEIDNDLKFFEKTAKTLGIKHGFKDITAIVDSDFEIELDKVANPYVLDTRNGLRFIFFKDTATAEKEITAQKERNALLEEPIIMDEADTLLSKESKEFLDELRTISTTPSSLNFDIEKFSEQFKEEYSFLYNANGYVAGYDEAVTAFDEFASTHADFIKEFVQYRGDFISSDREAAAFMFTLDKFILDKASLENSSDNKYTKSIDEPLKFIECLQLLDKLVQEQLIAQDENNPNNVLIYREAGENTVEGWYTENIHDTARSLLTDIEGQKYLRNVLAEKGIKLEFTDVLTPIQNLLNEFPDNDNTRNNAKHKTTDLREF